MDAKTVRPAALFCSGGEEFKKIPERELAVVIIGEVPCCVPVLWG
jgi:hypothetical protein